jgi:capsular polysaccharide biosynthesis protein
LEERIVTSIFRKRILFRILLHILLLVFIMLSPFFSVACTYKSHTKSAP